MALRADDVDLNRDGALVARFQSGDLEAFSELYRRYFARLWRFCQRRVGDSHEAEEIAQEAFTRAYRALPNLGGQRRFYPWVTVIAARLCVDCHRRRSRTEPSDRVDLGVVVGELDGLFRVVDHAYLNEALGRLAPRHREVLDLRERQCWTTARIAEHYGVNTGAVEALLHRARRSLRREFLSLAEGGGILGAVPLLGSLRPALGRRIQHLRARTANWSAQVGEWGGPLAAKTASAAIALGGTAVLGSAALAGGAPGLARVGPAPGVVLTVAGPAATSGSTPTAPPGPPSATSGTPAVGSTHLVTPAVTPAAGRLSPPGHEVPVTHTRVGRDPRLRRQAESQPTHVQIAGTTVGLDPPAAVDETLQPVLALIPADHALRRTP